MIPIKFKGDELTAINALYHELLDISPNQKNYINNLRCVNCWCEQYLQINLKELIKADYCKLEEIISKFDANKTEFPRRLKEFMIKTMYKKRFPRLSFVEKLGTTVCPYCNRNFINSNKKNTMCQLDHYYSKSDYPFLAVSFYNLVPVCPSCNHIKLEKKITYSPHNKNYTPNELLSFNFHITRSNFLNDANQIVIEINSIDDIIKENIKILKLKDVYEIHTDLVQECIKKAIIFESGYLDHLYSNYGALFSSKQELHRIVYGNYIEEDSYGKRPLSKLTADILNELLPLN